MNQAHYVMPGVIQITGHGRMWTDEEIERWYQEYMAEIAEASKNGDARTDESGNSHKVGKGVLQA